MRIFINKDQ